MKDTNTFKQSVPLLLLSALLRLRLAASWDLDSECCLDSIDQRGIVATASIFELHNRGGLLINFGCELGLSQLSGHARIRDS